MIPNLSSALSMHCEPEHREVQDGLYVHTRVCAMYSYKGTCAKYVQGYKRVNVWK